MTDDPDAGTAPDLDLSIVVITKNEEERVRDCVESVLAAGRAAVDSFEVILVDSASTDRTIERAREYPVTILQLPPDAAISAGAGRHVGERAARGDMILHVDGDMVLTESWLPEAVGVLQTNADVGAVRGRLNEPSDGIEELDTIGGLTLFDADVLLSVGGFDPGLISNEDLDVGFRVTRAGYRILRLPGVSATHPTTEALSEPLRRWSAGYYFGPGQAMRKWAGTPAIVWRLASIHNYEFTLLGWVGLGVLSTLATPLAALAWLFISVLGVGAVTATLGLWEGLDFLLAKTLGTVGMLIGVTRGTSAGDSFSVDAAEVLQEAPAQVGRRRSVDR